VTVIEKAKASLSHLAARYLGESGITVKDNAVLTQHIQNVLDAFPADEAVKENSAEWPTIN